MLPYAGLISHPDKQIDGREDFGKPRPTPDGTDEDGHSMGRGGDAWGAISPGECKVQFNMRWIIETGFAPAIRFAGLNVCRAWRSWRPLNAPIQLCPVRQRSSACWVLCNR